MRLFTASLKSGEESVKKMLAPKGVFQILL